MAGRPTKYKKEYCTTIIDVLKTGRNLKGFCADLGISDRCVYGWIDTIPEFAEAYAIAKTANEDYWLRLAISRANGNHQGSDTLIKFILSATHGYRERTDVTADVTADVSMHGKVDISFVDAKPDES